MDVPTFEELSLVAEYAFKGKQYATKDAAGKVLYWLKAMRALDADPLQRVKLAAAELQATAPMIELTMALSTAHVTKETAQAFQHGEMKAVIWHEAGDAGWSVYVPPDADAWDQVTIDNSSGAIPDDLFGCMLYARDSCCCRLLLDADAIVVEALARWDW